MEDTAICRVEICGRGAHLRGWCAPHYQRWLEHGDVQAHLPIGYRNRANPDYVYAVLVDYIDANRYAPSVRELGDLVGLESPSSVHAHLATLEREGRIERIGPRAIRILKEMEAQQ